MGRRTATPNGEIGSQVCSEFGVGDLFLEENFGHPRGLLRGPRAEFEHVVGPIHLCELKLRQKKVSWGSGDVIEVERLTL